MTTDATVAPSGPAAATPTEKLSFRIVLALFGLWLTPAVTVSVSPLINTAAMSTLHINEAQIGLVRTLEVLLNASLTIALSTILPRLKPRMLGLFGVTLMGLGNAGGAIAPSMEFLILARLCAGAGAACALSAGAAIIARVKSPQRAFGAVSIPITVFSVTSVLTAGYLSKSNAMLGALGVLAACATLGLLFVLFAPSAASAPNQRASSLAQFFSLIRRPYVLAAFFSFIAGTATWTFFARKGMLLGLDGAEVSYIISGVSVATGLFAALGAAIRDRWVPYIAVTVVITYALSNAVIAIAPSVTVFIVAYVITSLSYVIIQNTFTTISARIDRTGSMTAAGLGWSQLANSMAPATAGILITMTGSYAPLAILTLVLGTLTTTFIILAVRKLPPA